MKQKRNSHIRKSNYHPPKTQTEKPVTKTDSQSKRRAETVSSKKNKTASPLKGTARRQLPEKYPLPGRLIFWKRILKYIISVKAVLLFLILCLAGGSGIYIVHKLSSRSAGGADKEISVFSKKTEEPLLEMEKTEEIFFSPHCVESTRPENLISSTEVEVDGTVLDSISSYMPDSPISFNKGNEYTKVNGIVTFRGNNFRDSAAYGKASLEKNKLRDKWSRDTGSLSSQGTVWTGSGWTGQPLMQKWSKEAKAHMNMYDWAKEKENLVEVIYACMDGYVYFLDLETGKDTREPLYLGYTFKGSGALDPRGYPILYVGAGYNSDQGTARVFVINLLDCSTMYTFGDNDPFSLRGSLSFFDSSALVDAETDTLIYPGENGILYLIKLNTQYDPEAGNLSIDPGKTVKWHYYGTRSSTESFWVGMEVSATIYKNYLFTSDNGGNLMCLDLNSMELIWVQDILDDSNSTPVLSIEDGHLYLYVSTSFRLGWRSYDQATVPVWKINAETGEIIWQTDYQCYTDDGVSGGVQSTIAAGKNDLKDYVYVTVSKTDDNATGVLHCLDKKTGKMVWEHKAGYAWSSPVCVYDKDKTGRVIYCSSDGNMYLLDGRTGEVFDTLSLSEGVIEASPAVYGSTAVVGTRDCKIWGIELE